MSIDLQARQWKACEMQDLIRKVLQVDYLLFREISGVVRAELVVLFDPLHDDRNRLLLHDLRGERG